MAIEYVQSLAKSSFEKLPIHVDFGDVLQPGESVSSRLVTAFDSSGTDITSTLVASGTTAAYGDTSTGITVMLAAAGTDGTDTYVQFKATCSSGAIYGKTVKVRIKSD